MWKSMETAPKDGTEIIVAYIYEYKYYHYIGTVEKIPTKNVDVVLWGSYEEGEHQWVLSSSYDDNYECYFVSIYNPLCWMNKPEFPTDEDLKNLE